MTTIDTSHTAPLTCRAAPDTTGEHLRSLAALFRAQLRELPDSALDDATLIPNVTRRHLIGHMHYSALMLGRLAQSAISGEPGHRDDYIERWADWRVHSDRMPARHLRDLVRWSEEDLEYSFEELESTSGASTIATVLGFRVESSRLRWLRVRELAVHVVDLDTGVTFADLSSDLLSTLALDALEAQQESMADVVGWLTARTREPLTDGDARPYPCLPMVSVLE